MSSLQTNSYTMNSKTNISFITTSNSSCSSATSGKDAIVLQDIQKLGAEAGKNITPGIGGREKGMHYGLTAFFVFAQMAGAGFLALPRAIADSGWIGVVLLMLFGGSVAFAATRLGKCWVILETRWPRYRLPARQPYMDIAEMAFGSIGRKICFFCVIVTLMGYCITFIILMAEMMSSIVPALNMCEWILVIAALLLPATFLGTPKDFWQMSVLAVVATVITIIVILVQIIVEKDQFDDPQHPNPTIGSFSLGFGAILFALGGASVFPTIQNDMENRTDWTKCVLIAFSVIMALYIPVAVSAYALIGDAVDANILLTVNAGPSVTTAIALEIVNLLGTFLISFNPIGQALEDIFKIPSTFNIKRVLLRSSLVAFQTILCLAVPDFGAVLNLIGGSTITLLSFVFPPLMYLWLVDMKSDGTWQQMGMMPWERIFLWIIFCVGVVGGISSTISAFMVILDPESFGSSCFTNFNMTNLDY